MAIRTYMLMAIPIEHKDAINRMINVRNPDSGDNLSARLGERIEDETGVYANEPATHTYGGWWTDTAPVAGDLEFYTNLTIDPFVPPNGWEDPVLDGVTEQEVIDACAALVVVSVTGEDDASTPELARQTLFDQLDVAVVRVEI
jgi:hypothetical protein